MHLWVGGWVYMWMYVIYCGFVWCLLWICMVITYVCARYCIWECTWVHCTPPCMCLVHTAHHAPLNTHTHTHTHTYIYIPSNPTMGCRTHPHTSPLTHPPYTHPIYHEMQDRQALPWSSQPRTARGSAGTPPVLPTTPGPPAEGGLPWPGASFPP